MKITNFLSYGLLASFLTGCSTVQISKTEKQAAEQPETYINEYPTQERVEYVLNCIAKHGGLTFITKYACSCKIDKIAEKLTYQEYEQARTFTFMRSTPGEKGGEFRDPSQSKDLRTRLKDAEKRAEKLCFIK